MNNSEVYCDLLRSTSFLPSDAEIKERLFCVINDIKERQLCPVCNNPLKMNTSGITKYQTYCSTKCVSNSKTVLEKRKETTLDRYGVEYASQSEEVRQRIDDVFIKRYGVKNPAQSEEIKEKMRQTNLERYGVENAMQDGDIKARFVESNKKKYGVEYPMQNADIQETLRQTMIRKYGVPHATQNEQIKEKIKKTNLDRYGTEHPLQSEDVKEKMRQTNLERYGVKNFKQKHFTSDVLDKLNSQDWLMEQHHKKERTLTDISNELDVDNTTISVYMKNHNIEIRRYSTSIAEKEIADFIKTHVDNIQTNNRSILYPQELDIVIPDYNLAFEYCGLFWHSERVGKDRQYHKRKYDSCLKKRIQLITIFEDEWRDKQSQVKSKILVLMGKDPRERIYARKTDIVNVTKERKNVFFEKNHIQGDGPSSINIGLVYGGEVVAVMGFIQQKNKTYLNRYATSCHVIGGFSKLLNHFQQNYKWNQLVSFADQRWSNGNLYEKTGWRLDKVLEPDYYYSPDSINRYHKFNFRRKNLPKLLNDFDPNVSERENCNNNNILRIWDCGKQRWVINNK